MLRSPTCCDFLKQRTQQKLSAPRPRLFSPHTPSQNSKTLREPVSTVSDRMKSLTLPFAAHPH